MAYNNLKTFLLSSWGQGETPEGPISRNYKDVFSNLAAKANSLGLNLNLLKQASIRRKKLQTQFSDNIILISSGVFKEALFGQNRFLPYANFLYLTGLTLEAPPNCLLLISPKEEILYIPFQEGPESIEFFENTESGIYWNGPNNLLSNEAKNIIETCGSLQIKNIKEVQNDIKLHKNIITTPGINADIDKIAYDKAQNQSLLEQLSIMRSIKDKYEIEEISKAIEITKQGFCGVSNMLYSYFWGGSCAEQKTILSNGEKFIETEFFSVIGRLNALPAYETIAASGDNACYLHWCKNSGDIKLSDIVLLDAGALLSSGYSADITRSLDMSSQKTLYKYCAKQLSSQNLIGATDFDIKGSCDNVSYETFERREQNSLSNANREIYEAVLNMQKSLIDDLNGYNSLSFQDLNKLMLNYLAKYLKKLKILGENDPIDYARRYCFHSVGHHLGLNTHDCPDLPRGEYAKTFQSGICITVEPGLYFHKNDLTVPKHLRGKGVRIEDNIYLKHGKAINLSRNIYK